MPRPPFWNPKLGEIIPKGRDYPPAIWDMLDQKKTKRVLEKMALDESYRLRIWASAEED